MTPQHSYGINSTFFFLTKGTKIALALGRVKVFIPEISDSLPASRDPHWLPDEEINRLDYVST